MVLRALHLCSGYGGFELGLKLAGVECRTVAHVEREAHAAAVLVARMEDKALDQAPIWSDLETFDGSPWRGRVDIITAGFPCQPFSDAGLRGGTADDRWLWPDIARIIDEVGPSFVFLENVRGLVRNGLPEVLSDLSRFGFDAEWGLLRASDVGAPHKRERVWILGYASGAGRWKVPGSALGDEGADGWQPNAADLAFSPGEDVAYPESLDEREPEHTACTDPRNGSTRQYVGRHGYGVAYPEGEGLQSGDSGRFESSATTTTCSWSGLAVAYGTRLEGEGPPEGGGSVVAGEAGELADTESSGREGGRVPDRPFGEAVALLNRASYPPHPDDYGRWWSYIAEGGPEPGIRRSTDGRPPELVERLHLLGNGLVPGVAASAFTQLLRRLEENR